MFFLLLACSAPFTLLSPLRIRIPYLVGDWITLLTSELLKNRQQHLTHSTGERPPRVVLLVLLTHLPARRRMLDVGPPHESGHVARMYPNRNYTL